MTANSNIWNIENAWVDLIFDPKKIPPQVEVYMPEETPVRDQNDSFMLSLGAVTPPTGAPPLYKMELLMAAGQWNDKALRFFEASTFYEVPHRQNILRCNMEGKLNNASISLLMVTIEFDPKETAYTTTNFWEIKSSKPDYEQRSKARTTRYRWRG